MDLPNEHILDVFLQPDRGLTNDLGDAHRHEGHPRAVELPELDVLMTINRELRSNDAQIGAGDGLHNNNQIELDENVPQFIIFRGRPYSKLWQYMPLLVLMSSLVFRCILNFLGIDIQNSSLLGLAYSTHFNALQWIVLLATYYYKGFSI